MAATGKADSTAIGKSAVCVTPTGLFGETRYLGSPHTVRITFVISSLSAGGAERVMSVIANHLVGRGFSVTVITLGASGSDFFRIDGRITRIALGVRGHSRGIARAVWNNCKRLFRLRSAIVGSAPDIVISFLDTVNVLTLLATRFMGIPVVVSERTDPRQHRLGRVWNWLRSWSYPQAAMLVVQTDKVLEWAVSKVGHNRSIVIPNPVIKEEANNPESEQLVPSPYVLAVGRLGREKGFDLLLHAFGKICHLRSGWSLVILGEGPERTSLEAMARDLGIEERVHMPGRHKNPRAVMSRASLFVLPSRFEGFPNALLEAMSCGLPVISFDCPSGPGEIVRHGVDGVLVPPEDVDALASAILDLITHPEKRQRYASRAMDAADQFSMERVMGMWEGLLQKVAERSGR